MTKMNNHILCVIYGADLFGSERGTLQATRSIQEAGIKVTIVGPKRKAKSSSASVVDAARAQGHNVKLVQFGSHLKKSWILNSRNYRESVWRQITLSHRRFRTIVRDCQPSHIVIGSTSVLPYIIGVLFFTRIPIIYRMGDAPVLDSVLHRPLWKWLIRKSSTIVTISDYMKSHLLQHGSRQVYPQKVTVIRNIAPHREGPVDKALLSRLEHAKRPFQLVFVGQLTTKKGLDILIEALIQMDNPDIGCWIIGRFMGNHEFDESVKNRLEASSTRTQIELLGYSSDPRPYYKLADWHIAPSTYEEPLGNVVQEAQLQGTPSIVTNLGGLPELVDHQITGWILKEPTKEAITECIRCLIKTPEWAKDCNNTIRVNAEQYGPLEFSQAWLKAINAS